MAMKEATMGDRLKYEEALTALIAELAQVRKEAAASKDAARAALEWIKGNDQWKGYEAMLAVAKDAERRAGLAEAVLRSAAVNAFKATGEKKLVEGVEVKENREVVYEEDKALEWAKANSPIMIKQVLDRGMFEHMVLSGKIPNAPAQVVVEPKANIASNLERTAK